jgi:hypothetical protein
MNRSLVKIVFSAAAIVCFSGQSANAAATPDINQFFYPELLDAKIKVGADGNIRLIWDYVDNKIYSGSMLWILNPSGELLVTGSPMIPASVGWGKLSPEGKFFNPVSNIMLYAQPDGNTTLGFAYGEEAWGTTFGVWTYNSAGALIASAVYGPYPPYLVHEMYFDQQTGQLVVRWGLINGKLLHSHIVWSLNEYGAILSTAGPYGPFYNSLLGKVVMSGTNQIWYWSIPKTGDTHSLTAWEINSSGFIISAYTYGPF